MEKPEFPIVSVVVAARNAAATLGEAIESLLAQGEQRWEAIVVDDGSSDGTGELAASFAARDGRVRGIRERGVGVGAARNAGIEQAGGEWLLFLDADDWLEPHALAVLLGPTSADPALDLVYADAVRVDRAGAAAEVVRPAAAALIGEALLVSAQFATHACISRRRLVTRVGCFDPTLAACGDWDLWQRIVRMDARCAYVPRSVGGYRMAPAARDAETMLACGRTVLERTHGPDPRIPDAPGVPRARRLLPGAVAGYACHVAGFALGAGGDGTEILAQALAAEIEPLGPGMVAHILLHAVAQARCAAVAVWLEPDPDLDARLAALLAEVERRTGVPGTAVSVRRHLELLALDAAPEPTAAALQLGRTHAVALDVTVPLRDLAVPAAAERVYCRPVIDGAPLEAIVVPRVTDTVPAALLADAIAARHAWPLLGAFFERSTYATTDGGLDPASHDEVGWTVFLQELWGRRDWTDERFYPAARSHRPAARSHDAVIEPDSPWLTVEAADDLEHAVTGPRHVAVHVGGELAGVAHVAGRNGVVDGDALIVAITAQLGFELCRAAVRAGVIGRPLDAPGTLRERLAAAARARRAAVGIPADGAAMGWRAQVAGLVPDGAPVTVLARRPAPRAGTSADRVALLPAAATAELVAAAHAAGEAVIEGDAGGRLLYAPAILDPRTARSAPPPATADLPPVARAEHGDHARFDEIFARGPDPWGYVSDYEQVKYRQTLELVPAAGGQALEVGCAEGHFTRMLAPRVSRLTACDISAIALDRAARRCRTAENVSFRRLDLVADELPGDNDLVVCSEMLYFVGDVRGLKRCAVKLAGALAPEGALVTAHARALVDDPAEPGFDWDVPFGADRIGAVLAGTPGLELERELRTPMYRVLRFRRRRRLGRRWWRRPTPEHVAPAVTLPERVAERFRAEGGRSVTATAAATPETRALPILAYHRVSDDPRPGDPLRVEPAAFEAQLRMLHDGGYRSATVEQWRAAVDGRRALPGRRVMLTFDDGYRDLLTTAWPLLRRYGFGAIAFVVTDAVGTTNGWDADIRPAVPLLGWDELRALQAEGVEVGSHTATHARLTTLGLDEQAIQLARSRATLARELGAAPATVCYPYGDEDRVVRHLAAGVGYRYGFSCASGRSGVRDDPLALRRIEICADDSLANFVRKLVG